MNYIFKAVEKSMAFFIFVKTYTMKSYIKDYLDQKELLRLKDEEIKRQIDKRKFAEQTRNWTIILVVVVFILIWVL